MRFLHPGSGDGDVLGPEELDAAYWVDDPGHQFVSAMMIGSADGAAQLDGRSGDLGNSADAALFALLRAQAEVILVGAGTAGAEGYAGDHPSPAMREIRARHGLAPAPRMAVVTNRAAMTPADPLFTDTETQPLIITSAAAPPDRVETLKQVADVVIAGAERVDLAAALDALADRGMRRVSCEGGPSVLGQVIAAGRLDELRLTMAPLLVSGDAVRTVTGPAVVPPRRLELLHLLQDGQHLFARYRVVGDPV